MLYQIKADKIFIESDKHSSKARLYLSPKDEAELGGLGRLFILVEAKSREKKIAQSLQQIINELSEYYYHSPTKNTEAALETTAQYFNENVVDITGKNLKWIKDKINILIAGIQEDKLILTSYGQIKLWLFRDNKIHDVTADQGQRKATGKKILSQLISGKLKNNDVLLITNNTIFDYFSDEKIKKTVTTLAPTQACAFFKNTLLDYKIKVNFATILIKFIKNKTHSITDAQTEYEAFPQSQKDNAAIELNTEGYMARLAKAFRQTYRQYTEKIKQAYSKKKPSKLAAPKAEKTEKTQATRHDETAALSLKDKLINKVKALKIAEYRLFILIFIVAALFASSLWVIGNKKEIARQNNEFSKLATQTNNKIDSVESALIYKDKIRAQELLQEANQLLNSLKDKLDAKNPEQQKKYAQVADRIKAQINKVYQLETLNKLPSLAEFNIQPQSNLFLGPKNILYVSGQNSLYKINSHNKTLNKVIDLKEAVNKINDWEQNKIMLSDGQNMIWLIDTNNYSLNKITFKLPADNSQITDISSYAKKIYVLDKATNNIYKYRYNNGSFKQPVKWLKEEADVKQAQKILVDGNVWLVEQGGKIKKLFKGKEEIFNLKGLYEPLGEQIKLWTADNLNFLYIIDQEKNRIIIADKDGRVKRQLLGEGLEKILSVAPNHTENELYILTTNHVYKFGL